MSAHDREGTSAPATGPGSRVSRLALSREEAAQALGVSEDFFDEHVRPDLRIVYVGRRRLVPVSELQGWLDRHAARALEGRR